MSAIVEIVGREGLDSRGNASVGCARPTAMESSQRIPVNLARLDLVSLRLLVECASEGSISAAAGRCNMSIMGASKRIRRLEDSLGRPLLHRHRHGVTPTHAGEAAVSCATSVLSALHDLVAKVEASRLSKPSQGVNSGRRGHSADGDDTCSAGCASRHTSTPATGATVSRQCLP